MSTLSKSIIIYIGLYLLIAALLFIFQRRFIYFPTSYVKHQYSEIEISNEGETIRVIVVNPGRSNALLYFGGNAEAVANSAEVIERVLPNHTVYFFNYRGYGGSTGRPSEEAIYGDAALTYQTIQKSHGHITLMGRSLGTGVATYLAERYQTERLILVTPFDSIQRVAQTRIPIFPMSILLQDKYESFKRAKNIQGKVLILLAGNDEVIKRKRSMNLINSFKQDQVVVHEIKNAGHNSIAQDTDYYRYLAGFINDVFVK